MTKQTAAELQRLADIHRNNGEGLKAIEYYSQAANSYLQDGDKAGAAECWHMVGVSYKVENDIDAALENLHKAAGLHREAGNAVGVGRVYRDIGIAYSYRKQHDQAIIWLNKSVSALWGTEQPAELGISEAKVGLHYLEVGEYEQAEDWLYRGLTSIRQTNDWFYEMTALMHLAALRALRRHYTEAITTLRACVGLIYEAGEQDNQQRRLAQIYGLMAQALLGLNNASAAADYFMKAMRLLGPMADNVAAVVYDDIRAQEFLTLLNAKAPTIARRISEQADLARIKQ